MKVLLIGNYPPDDQKSMLAYSAMLARELPRLGCEVQVLSPPSRANALPIPGRLRKWAGYLDKFVLFLPALARGARWADVVHVCDHSNAMYMPRLKRHPTVLTCHDVIAIQAARGIVRDWQVGWTGRIFQKLIADGFADADRLVCVSAATQREVLGLGLAEARRTEVVPNGLNGEFGPLPADELRTRLAAHGLAPEDQYLLHVGHEHARKNRMAVLGAFDELLRDESSSPVRKLVFVGSALTQEMLAVVAALAGLAARVQVLRDVSHDDLRALYCGATALLFPSLQEGFGWPVIEAQACGCPVFTSDLAPMNEIGSDAAVYVDPRDSRAIAQAIRAAAPRFGAMREGGLANAARYSAAHMAARYVESYREVIEARQQGASGAVRPANR